VIPFADAAAAFRRVYDAEPCTFAFAPGRLNLIGEHIDYVGGTVLPMAISQGVTIATAPRTSLRRIYSDRFASDGMVELGDGARQTGPSFARLAAALTSACGGGGFDAMVLSDMPRTAAGLSSSAAFTLALSAAILPYQSDTPASPLDLCRLCQQAELTGLHVECGLMDQYSAVFAEQGRALMLDMLHLTHTAVPVTLDGARFVVVDSGQPRTLATSGYSERRAELRRAFAALGIEAAGGHRSQPSEDLLRRALRLPDPLGRRVRHVITEEQRVHDFAAALAFGNLDHMGTLLQQSHESLSRDFEVSTPEINMLVQALCEVPGVYGARIVGGGFGGAVIALTASDPGEGLLQVLRSYKERTSYWASLIAVEPGGAGFMADTKRSLVQIPLRDWLSRDAENKFDHSVKI
jgi:galactokinase